MVRLLVDRSVAVVLVTALGVAGCSGAGRTEAGSSAPAPSAAAARSVDATTPAPSTTSPESATSRPATSAAVAPAAATETSTIVTTTTAAETTTTAAPEFRATISEIGPAIAARMSASWREGCPVGLDGLRHLSLTHWDGEGRAAQGELVVAAAVADDIVTVFEQLFEAGFPIERMELVDVYEGDDDRSMAANNTSAFNCREVAWRPGVWSLHALGLAIDINPLVNPYVSSTRLLPPEGAAYADRSIGAPGMIVADDVVVRAFADIGWGWGGAWQSAKDYQHFSATGR